MELLVVIQELARAVSATTIHPEKGTVGHARHVRMPFRATALI